MPTPTPDEIADAAAEIAAGGVASATTDGQTTVALDPLKQIAIADKLAGRDAVADANANGGARSGWGLLRPARVVPPGGV